MLQTIESSFQGGEVRLNGDHILSFESMKVKTSFDLGDPVWYAPWDMRIAFLTPEHPPAHQIFFDIAERQRDKSWQHLKKSIEQADKGFDLAFCFVKNPDARWEIHNTAIALRFTVSPDARWEMQNIKDGVVLDRGPMEDWLLIIQQSSF